MNMQSYELAINEQNPHWLTTPYEHQFSRLHSSLALKDLDLDEMHIITGIRRCGKSTLLQTMINHLMKSQNPKSMLYINFDDPNYNYVCNNSAALYDVITTAEKLTGIKVDYLFLDEVQNVIAWEKYVKSMFDSKRFKKIVITGSNADLLNSNYASLLTGRYIETRLYPMSYKEVLLNHGITEQLQLIQQKPLALKLLDDMMKFGGFPRIHQVNSEEQRRRILKSYYETILLKDCIHNHNVRDSKTMVNLSHYLITNNSSRYSYNSLSKAIDGNENTIQKFIHIFENAYLLDELKQFSYSLKKQNRLEKKIYCVDNGLITSTTFQFSNNLGKLLENLVYTELKKIFNIELHFYNDNKECDFIIQGLQKPKAIQVCHTLDQKNREREISGLSAAMKEFSIEQGIIITYDIEEKISQTIQAIPFWKFFFNVQAIKH